MTHTPGPWFMSRTPDRDEEGWVGPEVYDRDLGVFAVLDGEPETIAQPWSEADARLIAAAPDLLEALEEIEALIRESRGVVGYHLNGNEAAWEELDLKVGTVLKKARGEA